VIQSINPRHFSHLTESTKSFHSSPTNSYAHASGKKNAINAWLMYLQQRFFQQRNEVVERTTVSDTLVSPTQHIYLSGKDKIQVLMELFPTFSLPFLTCIQWHKKIKISYARMVRG
jgi:hypothetical protein